MGRYLRLADRISGRQSPAQDTANVLDGIHTYLNKSENPAPAYDINDINDRRSAPTGTDHLFPAAPVGRDTKARGPWPAAMERLIAIRTPPLDVPLTRWRSFVTDCSRFGETWQATAFAIGWTLEDLLGCDPVKPFARVDKAGLCWLLDGRELLAIAADAAVIRASSGGALVFRPRPRPPGAIALPWELGG